ncbi:hypothetical protein [Micromonospora sp. NPDC005313]|uniref:hypothetical protein n=1 Tax=Micromonospora sp. NPDC005313 TaxID=3154296 RepID=UPI0033AA1F5C
MTTAEPSGQREAAAQQHQLRNAVREYGEEERRESPTGIQVRIRAATSGGGQGNREPNSKTVPSEGNDRSGNHRPGDHHRPSVTYIERIGPPQPERFTRPPGTAARRSRTDLPPSEGLANINGSGAAWRGGRLQSWPTSGSPRLFGS